MAAVFIAVLAAALLEGTPDAPPGYRIQQSLSLPGEARLEVLRDERLTSDIGWGADEDMMCADTSDDPKLAEVCASFAKQPLRYGMVRLVAKSGHVLDQRKFERELVWVESSELRGLRHPVFEVSVDYSTGVGSYRGPLTFFAEPHDGKFHWLMTRDAETGKTSELWVVSSLKDGWKLAARGGRSDVLAVHCRPDFEAHPGPVAEGEEMPFIILYDRYHFDGSAWLHTRRTEPGFLEIEAEENIPSEDEFPP